MLCSLNVVILRIIVYRNVSNITPRNLFSNPLFRLPYGSLHICIIYVVPCRNFVLGLTGPKPGNTNPWPRDKAR